MRTVCGSLYDYPRYYDLVFGSDWRSEFEFLIQCFRNHARRKVRKVFEPACGTGRLMYRLARAGYQVSGLDLNERAVAYCNERLARHGFPKSAFVGEMSNFRLPRKADAAFNTINSFRHLTSEHAAEAHLQCMSRALGKGGVYIVGLHLTPTAGKPMGEESWSARRGHLCVNTRLRTIGRNLRRRRERFLMTCGVHTPTRSFRLVEEIVFRTYTAGQFRRLLERVGAFEVARVYDFGYRIGEPIEVGRETEDAVFVLRKRDR
jgi:SAM-dependent methyltransferase